MAKILPDVMARLVQVRDTAMWEMQKELGTPANAIEAWQLFVAGIPKNTEYASLPHNMRNQIEKWVALAKKNTRD